MYAQTYHIIRFRDDRFCLSSADPSTGAIPNVYPLYTQGRTLLKVGVLPGYDLTHEAAFAKLLWLVSRKDLSFKRKQEMFQSPVAGEMSI